MNGALRAMRTLLPLAFLCACAERDNVDDAASGSIRSAAGASSSAQLDESPLREQFGDYTVIYSVVRSDALADEIARQHGVPSNREAALLNVTVQRSGANVPAQIDVEAVNLAQQTREIEMMATVANGFVSYVGVVDVSEREVVDFHLEILPEGAAAPIDFTFRESFFPVTQ